MYGNGYAYGNWAIVITIILISLFFIFKFLPMRTSMHKHSGGALIAFIVMLVSNVLIVFGMLMYYRLVRKEEQEALEKFPEQYRKYMLQIPMFFPKLTILIAFNSNMKR